MPVLHVDVSVNLSFIFNSVKEIGNPPYPHPSKINQAEGSREKAAQHSQTKSEPRAKRGRHLHKKWGSISIIG
jgi:hypothetical protein